MSSYAGIMLNAFRDPLRGLGSYFKTGSLFVGNIRTYTIAMYLLFTLFLVMSSSHSFSAILCLKAILICSATSPTLKCKYTIQLCRNHDDRTLTFIESVIKSFTNGLANARGINLQYRQAQCHHSVMKFQYLEKHSNHPLAVEQCTEKLPVSANAT